MPVHAEAGKPLYVVARDAIRSAIDDGLFEPGQRMPSTANISRQMKVSLVTAHRALGELVGDGLLNRQQGRGTFVRRSVGAETQTVRAAGRVGLVVHKESSLADHFHGQVLEGVRQAARAAHLDLMLLRFGDDLRRECDGFLWVNPLPGEVAEMRRRSGNRPCVIAGAKVPPELAETVAAVDADNRGLAETATKHLLDLGHRRLGYVGGGAHDDAASNARDRRLGFNTACAKRSVSVCPCNTLDAKAWRLEPSERQRLVEMLRGDERPTAIFAAGYYYALDVYTAASEAGLSLPGDLSVVGVDDPPSAAHLSPPLTTMRQPLVRLGHAAVAALVKQLSGEAVDHTISRRRSLFAELIIRGSTGPAA